MNPRFSSLIQNHRVSSLKQGQCEGSRNELYNYSDSPVMVSYTCINYYTIKTSSVIGCLNTLGTCNAISIVNAGLSHDFESVEK